MNDNLYPILLNEVPVTKADLLSTIHTRSCIEEQVKVCTGKLLGKVCIITSRIKGFSFFCE